MIAPLHHKIRIEPLYLISFSFQSLLPATPSDDEVLDTSATNHIIPIDISEDEVFNALTTLDPNKAAVQ